MVQLSAEAIAQVRLVRANDPRFAAQALRVRVSKGGCSGYSYGFSFDERRAGDAEAAFGDVRVVVDQESLPFLSGCVVTYEQQGLSAGTFKVQNPNATGHCGCGQSFSA